MTILRSRLMGRVASGVVAIGMLALLLSPTASAQTVAQLQAQIAALLAQINTLQAQLGSLQGGGAAVSCNFARDLTVGSQGADVQCLQQYLNGAGYQVAASGAGSPGQETQYFGPLTRAAVSAWQAANGVSPTAGYFGPISRAKYNSLLAASPGTPSTPGTPAGLQGGAGAINDADYVSGLNNEEVGEGENDVKVAGLRLEADDGSDIQLTAVNLNFTQSTGATRDFDRYADEVSVWLDGEELARVDADEFTDDNNFDKTVSLGSSGIIRAGDKGDLVVAVSGITNLDTNDAGDAWTLEFESIRFRDAQNAVISDTSTGDINDGTGRTFTFESFATATDVEFKITAGDDAINEQRVIDVDDTNDTDNVEFFSFFIEIKGTSDVVLDDIPFTFTSTGADVDEIINGAELWIDGAQVDSINIPTTATTSSLLTFDDFDHTLKAGQKVEAMVKVDINDLQGNFGESDTLLISIGENETNDGDFDAEDEEGNDLADADKTGSATTEAHTFYDNGFNVSLVSTSATITVGNAQASESDRGEFKIVWDITAFGSDIFIGTSTAVATTTTGAPPEVGANYEVSIAGTLDTDATSTGQLSCSNCDLDATSGAFQVDEGTTERFTLTVNVQASADNFFEVELGSIGWSADTDDTADANGFNFNLNDYDAGPIFLSAR